MAIIFSENQTHTKNLLAAELTRQVAVAAAAGSASAIKTAEIAYFRTALASAIANNCGTDQFTCALRELGVGGA
jgi:hypothetical protein